MKYPGIRRDTQIKIMLSNVEEVWMHTPQFSTGQIIKLIAMSCFENFGKPIEQLTDEELTAAMERMVLNEKPDQHYRNQLKRLMR